MNIKKTILTISLTLFALLFSNTGSAESITVTGSGSTFVINKNSGFDGVDGADRSAVLVAAVQFWADKLISPVDIVVDAEFSSSLFCTTNSATLGSAGPLSTYFNTGADSFGLQNNVWYPTALLNAHYGSDNFPGNADINASFNADLGDADCLSSSGWYYGLDGNPPTNYVDFYEVLTHELGHGLGFLSLINSDGSDNSGVVDIFTTFLHDAATSKDWTAMSNGERSTSVVNSGNVVWSGAEVNALSGDLSAGVNAGKVQMYAPNPYESGSSISHFDTALSPNELMEPQYTGDAHSALSLALLKDISWSVFQVNNAPAITGQSTLSTNEDTSLTLALSDLTVTDNDNSYPADFSLIVSSGEHYSVSGKTITPANNYYGPLSVPVIVNDGTADSASYSLTVTVNSVNDIPVINSQATLAVNEDNNIVISSELLNITDPDDSSFNVNLSAGANYSVSGTTVTPALNYNGMLTVPLTVNDGDDDSSSFNLTITVNPQNDPPVIFATPTVSFTEDSSHQFLVADFTISDPDSSSFSLQIMPGSNYAVSGNTITPALNFNGTLSVNAHVYDGLSYSSTVSFNVTVNSVNDNPVISSDGGEATAFISMHENSTMVTTVTSIDHDLDDRHTFTLSGGADQEKFSIDASTGVLVFLTAPDFETPTDVGTNNIYNVQVTITDDGSGSLTDAQAIAVSVTNINEAPRFTGTPRISGITTVGRTLSVIDTETHDPDAGDSVTLRYQWKANGTNISDATASTYTLTLGEIDKVISVELTAADSNNGTTSITSATTATITSDPNNIDDTTDSDNDGMSDQFEVENGLDPEDASDATGDLDGDGVTNLDEFSAGSDPTLDDYPPTLTPPADLTVDALGLFTAVNIGDAIAIDGLDGNLTSSVISIAINGADPITQDTNPTHFTPGVHLLTWRGVDAAGNASTSTQTINVNPMVNFGNDQIASEGNATAFSVILNGDAVTYPVYIPYTISGSAATDGSDHNLSDGIANIDSGNKTIIHFSTIDDEVSEGMESIVITMGTPVNAVKGSNTTHTVNIFEGNIAPSVSLEASQAMGDSTRTIVQNAGDVVIRTAVIDANSTDTHTYDWSGTDNTLSDTDGDLTDDSFTFDPSDLQSGQYTLRVIVSDGDKHKDAEITLVLVDTAPVLTTIKDSDGDGTDDLNDGYTDSDGDGIANYLDAIAKSNLLQEKTGQSGSFIIESDPGLTLTLSEIAFAKGKGQAEVSMQDIVDIDGRSDQTSRYNYQSGLFDFNVSALPVAGQSVNIVLPQLLPVPARAVYRKLMPAGWQDFVVDSNNIIATAAGNESFCPPPGDIAYQVGLTEGHWCVQLTIEDGGDNDADNAVNNRISDPGGVAEILAEESNSDSSDSNDINESSSGGGGIAPLWVVLLGLFTILRRRVMTQTEKLF